jgi:hypothetical protein
MILGELFVADKLMLTNNVSWTDLTTSGSIKLTSLTPTHSSNSEKTNNPGAPIAFSIIPAALAPLAFLARSTKGCRNRLMSQQRLKSVADQTQIVIYSPQSSISLARGVIANEPPRHDVAVMIWGVTWHIWINSPLALMEYWNSDPELWVVSWPQPLELDGLLQ